MSGRLPKVKIDKYLEEYAASLKRLVEIYYETDPSKNETSQENKFYKAIEALNLAHRTSLLSQWAEAHIISVFQNNFLESDSHWHESEHDISDISKYRKAIAFILSKTMPTHGTGYHFPAYHGWRENLEESLHAINEGEVFPLLQPIKHKKFPNKFSLEKLRMASVLHVYRLWPKLGTKDLALEYVAKEINLDKENIRKWERTLGKSHDPDKTIRNAVKQGFKISQAHKNKKRLEIHKMLSEDEQISLMHYDMLLWDFPIKTLGPNLRKIRYE